MMTRSKALPRISSRAARARLLPSLSLLVVPLAGHAAPPDTLVITAARFEQPVPDTLPSTRVLTRADIEAAQSADMAELLRQTTSLDIGQAGPLGSQTSVFLRGADSRQVLVLIDGVPFARADFGSASWQHIALDQVERVEIVRGNLSALYGAQAVGGVVQIVTRRAAGLAVDVGGGTQATAWATLSGARQFGEGETATRLAATLSRRQTGGYSAKDPAASPGANPDRDAGQQTALSAQVQQGWAAGQRTMLSLMKERTRSDYDGFDGSLDDRLTSDIDSIGLQSRHALAPAWELGVDLGRTRERFNDPTGFAVDGESQTELAGLQLQWQTLPGHTLQVGLDSKQERFIDSNTPEARRRVQGLRLGWLGHFGAAGEGVDLQAHLRADDSSAFGAENTVLLALGWHVAPGWTLSAQVANGYSAPSFVDQQYAPVGVALKAEHSRDAELGLRWRDGAWFARATLFAQKQRDRISFDPVTFETVNIARASNQGLELMAEGPVGPGLMGLEATFQNPRDESQDVALKRRARESAAVNYRLPVDAWQLGAWLRYSGARLDTDPATFSNATNPSRTTLALTAQRPLGKDWTLAFKLDNATGEGAPEVLGYTAAPRAFTVQLRGQWR